MIRLASRRNNGVPRVTAELRRQDRPVNRKRVARAMREHGIAGNSRRTGHRSLTRVVTEAAPSPDLIGRDFAATRPGTKIVGDTIYIPTAEGWLCFAAWLDLATREVIGYSMADHHRTEIVVDALDMAAAESFWAVLKEEIVTRFRPDRATARAGISDFIETFYNRRSLRKHVHWGHLTLYETRLRHQQDQALAA
ncbi:Integrase core domain protein [Streptomyces sp. ADI95-17]|nr:Integrase core domain protein [Streptomyces sp. ADI95-17]